MPSVRIKYRTTTAVAMAAAMALAMPGVSQTASPPATSAFKLPVYDVVSIKLNKTGSNGVDIDINDGNFLATNVPLKSLILQAYGLKDGQLEGLPPWARSTRFDIKAKVVEPDKKMFENLKDEQYRAMLQPILTERFHLQFHYEKKVLPVYELVVAKGGPKFKASELKQGDGKTVKGLSAGSIMVHNRNLTAVGISMDTLISHLASPAQRVVVDKTGLTGTYDFELKYSPDDGAPQEADAPPTFFTALQEQLGLKLEAGKAPVDTLVIDHAEIPVED